MASKENLLIQRNELRALLTKLPEILDKDPEKWYPQIARGIIFLKRKQDVLPPETRDYLIPIFDRATHILYKEAAYGKTIEKEEVNGDLRGLRAHLNMVNLSQEISKGFEAELEEIPERFIPIDELIAAYPDMLSRFDTIEEGIDFTNIGVRHPLTGMQYSFKLPLDDTSYHKGGIARLSVEILAGSRLSMLQSEIPWHDVDIYTVNKDGQETRRTAKLVGADEQGIEVATGHEYNFTQYANGRDTTQNQALLGRDGLHYSDAAYEAARTGHIEVVGHYIPDRAIYGVDRYPTRIDDKNIILAKPRGIMRYIKALAEEKALSFDYLPINQNLDLGIYWLVLAKKWAKEPDTFPDRMQRMFYVAKQMGQTREDEKDVMDALTRAHIHTPFFDINHTFSGEVGVARWIGGKLVKQIDREFGWTYGIPSGLEFVRTPGDTELIKVSIDGYQYDPAEERKIKEQWGIFVNSCNRRLQDYNSLGIDPAERYFTDVDMQGLPDYIQEIM
jgi:hypothetical protein